MSEHVYTPAELAELEDLRASIHAIDDAPVERYRAALAALRGDPAQGLRPSEAPEWIWYGEVDGKPVVTFGRWPKHGAKWRYKWAEIQPTEHDHSTVELPKRPFAFAVQRAPENGPDQWRLFLDEGLYRVGDRRSAINDRSKAYKRAWDAYVEMSMDSSKSTFDCIKAAVDAATEVA